MWKKFVEWLASSFDTDTKGASARKLSAFVVNLVITIVVVTYLLWAYKHNSWEHYEFTLITLCSYSAALLGMTTYSGIKLSNNQKDTTITTTENSSKTTETKAN